MSVKLKYGLIFLLGWVLGVVGVLVSWREYAEHYVHGQHLEFVQKLTEDSQLEANYRLVGDLVDILRSNQEGTLEQTNKSLCSLIMTFIGHLEREKRTTLMVGVDDINKIIDEGNLVISETGVCSPANHRQ